MKQNKLDNYEPVLNGWVVLLNENALNKLNRDGRLADTTYIAREKKNQRRNKQINFVPLPKTTTLYS